MTTAKQARLPIVMLCLFVAGAEAATPREEQLRTAPMPHVALGPGKTAVAADWVHLQGYFEGSVNNAARLADMKARSAACVADHRGQHVDPPAAWPDFLIGHRTEQYSSEKMSITYEHALVYELNPATCGLTEAYEHTATLTSARGSCQIDLVARTAVGACDPLGASGPPTTAERLMALSARLPGAVAARAPAPPAAPNQRKRILGIECTVWPHPFDQGGSICLAPGRLKLAVPVRDSGLLLEMTSSTATVEKAVEARVGVQVNGAVFTPHLAGGFAINQARGAR
jgi:hypothetical protein